MSPSPFVALALSLLTLQSGDWDLRVLPWYAAQVVAGASGSAQVVFTLGADSSARMQGPLARAFRRANLPLAPHMDVRGGDTLQIFFTNVVTDSVTADDAFLKFGRTSLRCASGRVVTKNSIVSLRCNRRACTDVREEPIDEGLEIVERVGGRRC